MSRTSGALRDTQGHVWYISIGETPQIELTDVPPFPRPPPFDYWTCADAQGTIRYIQAWYTGQLRTTPTQPSGTGHVVSPGFLLRGVDNRMYRIGVKHEGRTYFYRVPGGATVIGTIGWHRVGV